MFSIGNVLHVPDYRIVRQFGVDRVLHACQKNNYRNVLQSMIDIVPDDGSNELLDRRGRGLERVPC